MKTGIALGAAVAVAALVGFVAQRRPELPSHAPADEAPRERIMDFDDPDEPPQMGDAGALTGRVQEVIDVAEYTYLRLATGQGEVWAAVSKATIAVNSNVTIENATRMEHFTSSTLKRTFDLIYFGNLQSAGNAQLPPGHPSIDGAAPHVHGGSPAPAEGAPALDAIKVSRALGGNARTVAELFTQGSELEGKLVRVRGQVVKVTAGVLGKTYLRLRDGSSTRPEQLELVVTSTAETQIGVVAAFEGTLRNNVDVGIGFAYPVLLENASIVPDSAAAR